jgi:serine/threonine protein kinase
VRVCLCAQYAPFACISLSLCVHALAHRTRSSFVGTAEYIAPEMLDTHETCRASDLFALGSVLYQMVSVCCGVYRRLCVIVVLLFHSDHWSAAVQSENRVFNY